MAVGLLEQIQERTGGHRVDWSLGGGTAMMLQIGHRESHDIDVFLDDAQLLGLLDPSKADLHFDVALSDYTGDGARFQKFAFADIGEIDFIVAGALTKSPFIEREIEGRSINLESVAEVIAKKVYHRGSSALARDIFDIAAAARTHRPQIIDALRAYPDHVQAAAQRIMKLNPEFVNATINQLMIAPAYRDIVETSIATVSALFAEVLSERGR